MMVIAVVNVMTDDMVDKVVKTIKGKLLFHNFCICLSNFQKFHVQCFTTLRQKNRSYKKKLLNVLLGEPK
uniref:Uncharacterized protein n=1 Tax=Arion vulgaris TaxID=1028688 RepID=A0A0B7AEB7_9EUPU